MMKRLQWGTAMGSLMILTMSCALSGAVPLEPDTSPLKELLSHYRDDLRLMTPTLHFVDPMLSLSCRMALPSEIEASKEKHGPHFQAAINIYTNDLGQKALDSGATTYPVGTLIIKEKNPFVSQGKKRRYNIGGMIKQAKGYDPQNGDWAYFYQTAEGKLDYGKLKNCRGCHAGAKAQDFVYKSWLKPAQKTPQKTPKTPSR